MVKPLCRTVWRFLRKLKIDLPYDPVIPLLGISPEKNMFQKDTQPPMFIAALLTIAKIWKQHKCLSTEEWIKKIWCVSVQFSSFQFSCSVMPNSLRPHELQHARPPCPSPTPRVYSNSCPSVMSSSHLILSCPLLLLPSIFPSIRVFSIESVLCIRWPKDWSFSFSISPSSEHPGLISFRMD